MYGYGQEVDGGWILETRLHKMNFEDEELGLSMAPGQVWGFNIGMDDDDGADLALQYWWANRVHAISFTPENEWYDLLTDEELESKAYLDPESEAAFWDIGVNANGRLSPAGAGEIIFGEFTAVAEWCLY